MTEFRNLTFQAVAAARHSHQNSPSVHLSFKDLQFADPGGIAGLACWLEDRQRAGIELLLDVDPANDAFQYLQNMNLFAALGIELEERFKRHDPGKRFVRMERVDWQADTDDVTARVASCLAVNDRFVRSRLHNCLSECADNIKMHAAGTGYVIAQKYPRTKEYRLALVDFGVGIRHTLCVNPDFAESVQSDQDALEMACQRGTSGKKYMQDRNDPRHFGQGLFEVDTIATAPSCHFALHSGGASRFRNNERVHCNTAFWQGTALILHLAHDGLERAASEVSNVKGGR